MGWIAVILIAIVVGLVIGALARLVVPGRNPIGLGMTIVVGIVGSIVGGLIGRAIVPHHGVIIFLIEVGIAALLVALLSGSRSGRRSRV